VRIAFFGTSALGAEVLSGLAAAGELEITTVVSQPDRPAGRRRRPTAPPVAVRARELGLPLVQTERASAEPPAADAGVVVAFGQIVREPLLSAYPLYNLHPSLLPRWRGAAPIERAIMAGDEETAVCVIGLTAELDAGPVYARERFPIGAEDDAGALYERTARLGPPLLRSTLRGERRPEPQPAEGVTYAARLTAADRLLDWTQPAAALARRVRALSPHIGARAALDERPVVVWRSRALESGPAPGAVAAEGGLVVGCGQGALELLELQPAGGRRMSAAELLRGLRERPRRAS
jgi:methionyl-tRNA formyltransferase